jgi:thymidylate synthase (FAD)
VRKEAERITKNCAASKGKSSMNITLDWITPNAEAIIEKKGRICWQSVAGENDEDGDLIHKLIMKGHTSVLEHGCASFTIDGMSRACSHQLVRHRLASYSQKSQRYVSEAQFEYIIPHTIEALGLDAVNNYVDQMRQIQDFYNYWKKLGVRGEDARFVLPNACTTEIGMTTNFREWRGIFELRCDRHAQWEIREMCCKILEILHHECPNVFGDLYDKYMKQV